MSFVRGALSEAGRHLPECRKAQKQMLRMAQGGALWAAYFSEDRQPLSSMRLAIQKMLNVCIYIFP